MGDGAAPRVFLSYRRRDAPGAAGRIHDALSAALPPDHLFMDVDSIEAGEDFVEKLRSAVSSCDVMLAVIGRDWAPERLASPTDLVRLELEIALERGVRVIPVIVEEGHPPTEADFPPSLAPIARRQAIVMNHLDWHSSMARLRSALGLDGPAAEVAAPAPPRVEPRRFPVVGIVGVVAALVVVVVVGALVGSGGGDDDDEFSNPTGPGRGTTPASGPIVYRESFEAPGAWDVGDDVNGSLRQISGETLEITLLSPTEFTRALVPTDLDVDDVVVEVTVQGSGDNSYSIWCAGSAEDDGYELNAATDGTWVIRRHESGGVQVLDEGSLPSTTVSSVQADIFRLSGRCAGGDLSLFVDGTEVGSAHDDAPLAAGRPGFGLRVIDGASAYAMFDDLAVREA